MGNMAKIIFEDREIEVADGGDIRDAVEELGVPFGCFEGICGSCVIDILEGEENLTPVTPEEKDFELHEKKRFACQCQINQGLIKITF